VIVFVTGLLRGEAALPMLLALGSGRRRVQALPRS
jgi:hypothetical protein